MANFKGFVLALVSKVRWAFERKPVLMFANGSQVYLVAD